MNGKAILNLASSFQNRARKVMRYEGNPYVDGDTVAEHIALLCRLLTYVSPELEKEFPEENNLIKDIFISLVLHDDDEVIDGYDIVTSTKNHNSKDEDEIEKLRGELKIIGNSSENLIDYFKEFRSKSTLAARISKALDNLAGNQLVIDQKIGLINPHQAKFAIEYADKVRGICNTTDRLIDTQIEEIVSYRNYLLEHQDELRVLLGDIENKTISFDLLNNLLKEDLVSFEIEKEKINTWFDSL